MSSESREEEAAHSRSITLKALDDILCDFGLARKNGKSRIELVGSIPAVQETKSEHVNMTLIGAVPSLANAVAASQIFEARGGQSQSVAVDLRRSHNYLDPDIGMTPTINGQVSKRFTLKVYTQLTTADLERAAERAGLPIAIIQSEESWKATEQGRLMASLPIVPVTKVTSSPPKPLSLNPTRPLEGLKVLCVTHAIAGPSSGRTLAEYGASVLQVMYTHGFEHPFVYTYANLGCASTRLNFNREGDRSQMWKLVRDADVWIDSYRDGAMRKFGFTDENLHACNPSLIISHVRVYGTHGPWASKPGFDMQGSASSGMMALCGGGLSTPAWPPGQVINDYTTGYYGALAIQATILRRMKEGGGYILSPSLTGTAMSILKHFKTSDYPELTHCTTTKLPPMELTGTTGMGVLKTLRPLPELSETALGYGHVLLSVMGSDLPVFPGFNGNGGGDSNSSSYDVENIQATKKEELVHSWQSSTRKRVAELKDIRAGYCSPP